MNLVCLICEASHSPRCVFLFVLSSECGDGGSCRLTLCFSSFSFVGNTEIDVDIKRYYCKAGIKSIQVQNVPFFDVFFFFIYFSMLTKEQCYWLNSCSLRRLSEEKYELGRW